MKTINVIVLTTLCCLNSLNAQDKDQNIQIYRTWVYLNVDPHEIKGVLYEINDTSVFVSSSFGKKGYFPGRLEMTELNINNIDVVKTRKNNNIIKGVLIGAVVGFVTGGSMGLISGDDPPDPPCNNNWGCSIANAFTPNFTAEQKALSGGSFLAICGAGVGALVGSIKIKIPIYGSIETYRKNQNRLKKYTYKK